MTHVLIVAKRIMKPDRSQTLRHVTLEGIPASDSVRQLPYDELAQHRLLLPQPEDVRWIDPNRDRRRIAYWYNDRATHNLVDGPDPCRTTYKTCRHSLDHVRYHHPPTTYYYTWWEVPEDMPFKLLVRDFVYDPEHNNTFTDHIVLARPGGELLQQPNGSDDTWWKDFKAETYHTGLWTPLTDAELATQTCS